VNKVASCKYSEVTHVNSSAAVLKSFGKIKSDSVFGEILKLGGKAMIPNLV
jgi:hypothetical protein